MKRSILSRMGAFGLVLGLLLSGCGRAAVTPAPAPTPVTAAEPTEETTPAPEPTEEPVLTVEPEEFFIGAGEEGEPPEVLAMDLESYLAYFSRAAAAFCQGKHGENLTFSPADLYLALGMLAEVTAGESREEITSALSCGDMDALLSQCAALGQNNRRDRRLTKSILSASLWLDTGEGHDYRPETVEALRTDFAADVFSGAMGSDALNRQLRDWLNENTGGLLSDSVAGEGFDPRTVLALAAAGYYSGKFTSPFPKELTEDGVFHALSGEQTVPFMHQTESVPYYDAGEFDAVALSLYDGWDMWLVRPKEGLDPAQTLSGQALSALLADTGAAERTRAALSVPRFDVNGKFPLETEVLPALGITSVLDMETADFSPLAGEERLALSQATHAARLKLDEEGVEAAAYTVIQALGAAFPTEEPIDFTLDRPFAFVLTDPAGAPAYAGTVCSAG